MQRFARNTDGRDLIVGDIHGHFTKLQAALDLVGFDPARDRLFSVGDLVDRGPECDHVLDWLAKPWFYPVQGNHEDMAIRWPSGNMPSDNYAANGGGWNISNPVALQHDISEALRVLPLAIELETAAGLVGIVHAECPFNDWDKFRQAVGEASVNLTRTMMDRIEGIAQWSRTRIDYGDKAPVHGVHALVVGHTPVPERLILGNVHYIDTGAWLPDGRGYDAGFTLLDAATLEVVLAPVGEVAA
jgi:serine/threonine protein phosphatase 1